MKIKIGDKISANKNREGVIDSIHIALSTSDIAGELGVDVEEYDTELNYKGSVSYTDEDDRYYWAYFHQIENKITENEVHKKC